MSEMTGQFHNDLKDTLMDGLQGHAPVKGSIPSRCVCGWTTTSKGSGSSIYRWRSHMASQLKYTLIKSGLVDVP